MPHISDEIAEELEVQGWTRNGYEFRKRIVNFEPAGTVSDGTRIVCLRMESPSYRWLERVDGFGRVEREIDLRNFTHKPTQAIAAALK